MQVFVFVVPGALSYHSDLTLSGSEITLFHCCPLKRVGAVFTPTYKATRTRPLVLERLLSTHCRARQNVGRHWVPAREAIDAK